MTENYEVREQGKIFRYKEDDEQVWFESPFKEGKIINQNIGFGCTEDKIEIYVEDVLMGYLHIARMVHGKFIREGFEPLNFMNKHIII